MLGLKYGMGQIELDGHFMMECGQSGAAVPKSCLHKLEAVTEKFPAQLTADQLANGDVRIEVFLPPDETINARKKKMPINLRKTEVDQLQAEFAKHDSIVVKVSSEYGSQQGGNLSYMACGACFFGLQDSESDARL